MYERNCLVCGALIVECMGFVFAGDFVKAVKGDIPFTSVRERCGRCVLKILLLEEGYTCTIQAEGQR